MKLLNREELQRILAPHPAPCLSLFMRTHRHPPDSDQDPIRFKNLLKDAERLLSERYVGKEKDAVLGPVAALATPELWRDRADGLAVFQAQDHSSVYRLPVALPDLAVVADSFHVKPVLGFLQSNQTYYVLVLSQNAVSLWVGTAAGAKPVDLSGLPRSLTEALGIERKEAHTTAFASAGGAVFQGRGAPEATKKDDLLRFFRAIDQALWQALREERAPLFLAGAGYTFPIYREVSRYPHLAPGGLEGSFEGVGADDLHRHAWPAVQAHLHAVEDDALAEYERLYGRKLSSDILTEVAQAAVQGRVRRLLLGRGKRLFGRLDRTTGEVTLHGPAQIGPVDDDVLDDLAEVVLTKGGEILVIEQRRMPGDAAAAATFRW
ncbi:hypothetical protein FBQ97_10145 [Acidobacteria bacterium ACD]|nr:MAG: hypothetical protein EDX89_14455 [Acidobacteriota bacterium]MCE7958326.1 hypothetical protein [Acidobacteria bacterium ACB2]MDL1950159.1 hypothetical protein [Acidobacteria bacterium ACD]